MRNGLSISLLLIAAGMTLSTWLGAQKIDIDKKAVTTKLLTLPYAEVDTAFHTYSSKLNGSHNLSTWGLDLDAIKNQYFKLAGYNAVENGGDLQLEATLSPVKFLDSNVESRTEKTKDKAGRETSKTYYKHTLTYTSAFTWKMRDKNGKDFSSRNSISLGSDVKKHTGSEYGTYKEAYDSYNNNRGKITGDIATKEIKDALGSMYESMNAQFGYKVTTDKFNIWVLDTKSHPEYEAMQKHYDAVKAAFGAISPAGLTDADMEALQPSIAYYLSIPEKYKKDEKADTKLRYAAYFNLANIYLFLDKADKVTEYANLIIKNDYDKGDGKDFLKDAEKLQELLTKKKVASRRFPRI
jgi:hypothetical protein